VLLLVFQNLFPARGRKLEAIGVSWLPVIRFSEPIPRKGTETGSNRIRSAALVRKVFQNLFPARGRKRTVMCPSSASQNMRFSEPIPRKGTETPTFHLLECKVKQSFFRTYSPQGDGNLYTCDRFQYRRSDVFQNLFPARGRKRIYNDRLYVITGYEVFQNLFPARGRKR